MGSLYGRRVAWVVTALVLWAAFGSVFALLLGFSFLWSWATKRWPFNAATTSNNR